MLPHVPCMQLEDGRNDAQKVLVTTMLRYRTYRMHLEDGQNDAQKVLETTMLRYRTYRMHLEDGRMMHKKY